MILKPDEIQELRELWTVDLGSYWTAVTQIARERKQLARDVSEEAWRGTYTHELMWGKNGRGRKE